MRKFIWSIKKRLVRLNPRPRVFDRLGARWELDPRDWLDLRIILGQPFEVEQLQWFLDRVGARKPELFFDVGANVGLYSVLAAQRVPEMTIQAFEPVAMTRARLMRNLELNALNHRVKVHSIALSEMDGMAEIAIDPQSSGLSTLARDTEEARRRNFTLTETVSTNRLDDLFPNVAGTIALKIDVEGHELAALAGMENTLLACNGVAMIEARASNASAVRKAMTDTGWIEKGQVSEELFFEKPA